MPLSLALVMDARRNFSRRGDKPKNAPTKKKVAERPPHGEKVPPYGEKRSKKAPTLRTRCTRGDARSFFCTYKTYLYAQN